MGHVDSEALLNVVDLRGVQDPGRQPLPRAALDVAEAAEAVSAVLADVRTRGAQAVLDAGARFDGVTPPQLKVPQEVISAALADLDPALREALQVAIGRVRAVHTAQMPEANVVEVAEGGTVAQRWIPVDRVGLYVPGGRAVYPSSVIMNVVPAQTAGVESLAVVSPPQPDNNGWPHPVILAACALLDIDEVYAAGGAQAVALLAYGADLTDGERCEPVAMVTGPGNIYVTAAKRLLRGVIGIDSEAGPTEIMVIADDSADPQFVAADLISQAEHDVVAAAVLVTDSPTLADEVQRAVVAQVADTKHSERITQALQGQQSAIVLVDDIDAAMAVSDGYAAEHLEIHTVDARNRAMSVHNAGAVFVGPYTPVSLGDYAAGSNHVLPTGGCACHSSGLGVHTFLRSVQVVEYSKAALASIADTVTTLAAAEDLPAHGTAITVRSQQ
jgi:histidinol dehydrogenase